MRRTYIPWTVLRVSSLSMLIMVSLAVISHQTRSAELEGVIRQADDTLRLGPGFRAQQESDETVRIYGDGDDISGTYNCKCLELRKQCQAEIANEVIRCIPGKKKACDTDGCKISVGIPVIQKP